MMMPRMKGAAMQCCMCLTGVFMFLGGIIMLATGITLILNYGFFDEELLPPDLQNEEGKRTVGIILTCCGLLAIVISVIVSVMYFCFKSKPTSINPDDLTRIPNSTRNNTPDLSSSRRSGDRRVHSSSKVPNGATRSHTNAKPIPGSAEVKLPRQYKKGRHKHRPRHVRRLEEIKEQDAISRKTVDGALIDDDYNDTPRSGSFSSELTVDDPSKTIPKVVLNDRDMEQNRPPSECSVSTSVTSDNSNNRYLDGDKSRRELQFMPDSMRQVDTGSKDSTSFDRYDELSPFDQKSSDRFSETSEILRQPPLKSSISQNSDYSAGGIHSSDSTGAAHSDNMAMQDSDSEEIVTGYKTSHYLESSGMQTAGRMTPQVGAPEVFTIVEPVRKDSGVS
ncbi:hypothetical protein ACF0H5_001076 [Mactra antiquata]